MAVSLGKDGAYFAEPVALAFSESIGPVLAGFDAWIEACERADVEMRSAADQWDAAARASYVAFLRQYRACLASEGDASSLEAAWTKLDHLWMDTKMPVQIVHDIENFRQRLPEPNHDPALREHRRA